MGLSSGAAWLSLVAAGAAAATAAMPEQGSGAARWLMDAKSGCYVLYREMAPADSVSWSGVCVSRAADGPGAAVFSRSGRMVLTVSGHFSHGAASGHIAAAWADGAHFDGNAEAGRFNGPGVLVDSAGTRTEGEWRNGVLMRPSAQKSTISIPDDKPVATAAVLAAATPPVAATASAPNGPSSGAVTSASSKPASWLDAFSGRRLIAADGGSLTISISGSHIAREMTAAGGSAQRVYLTLLNAAQGSVAEAQNGNAVGLFRLEDSGWRIDYANGAAESMSVTAGGGLVLTTSGPAQAPVCTAWYPEGHQFSLAERQAAVAAYAVRLGVSDTAPPACAGDATLEAALPKPDAAIPIAPSAKARHHNAKLKTAALLEQNLHSEPVLVRNSEVHPADVTPANVAGSGPSAQFLQAATVAPQSPAAAGAPQSPSECLSVEANGGAWGFRNACGFPVQFAYCLKESAERQNSCDRGGAAGGIPANAFAPLFAESSIADAEHDFRWIGCGGPSGAVIARLVRSDPPAGECVRQPVITASKGPSP